MTFSSQEFESYVPVYDSVPEKWEDGREFLVEHLKKISNAVNIRTIGWLLDEELLSGQQFIPSASSFSSNSSNSQQFRTVLRKVVDLKNLAVGVNPPVLHGITFDINFTLIDLWVSGTNSTTFTTRRITGNDVLMTATQLIITSPQVFDRAFAFIEYIQEL
jgi:hypothetical protein